MPAGYRPYEPDQVMLLPAAGDFPKHRTIRD